MLAKGWQIPRSPLFSPITESAQAIEVLFLSWYYRQRAQVAFLHWLFQHRDWCLWKKNVFTFPYMNECMASLILFLSFSASCISTEMSYVWHLPCLCTLFKKTILLSIWSVAHVFLIVSTAIDKSVMQYICVKVHLRWKCRKISFDGCAEPQIAGRRWEQGGSMLGSLKVHLDVSRTEVWSNVKLLNFWNVHV